MKGGNINYKNNGDAIYVGSFLTVHNPLFWCNGGHPEIFITVRHTNNINIYTGYPISSNKKNCYQKGPVIIS